MPVLEAGLFIIMLVLGLAFTLVGFKSGVGKLGGLLHIFALAFFIGLSMFMSTGYEVSATTKGGTELHYNATGHLIENVTKADTSNVMLPGGTDSYWLGYVFMGFSIMNFFMFVRDIYET